MEISRYLLPKAIFMEETRKADVARERKGERDRGSEREREGERKGREREEYWGGLKTAVTWQQIGIPACCHVA